MVEIKKALSFLLCFSSAFTLNTNAKNISKEPQSYLNRINSQSELGCNDPIRYLQYKKTSSKIDVMLGLIVDAAICNIFIGTAKYRCNNKNSKKIKQLSEIEEKNIKQKKVSNNKWHTKSDLEVIEEIEDKDEDEDCNRKIIDARKEQIINNSSEEFYRLLAVIGSATIDYTRLISMEGTYETGYKCDIDGKAFLNLVEKEKNIAKEYKESYYDYQLINQLIKEVENFVWCISEQNLHIERLCENTKGKDWNGISYTYKAISRRDNEHKERKVTFKILWDRENRILHISKDFAGFYNFDAKFDVSGIEPLSQELV